MVMRAVKSESEGAVNLIITNAILRIKMSASVIITFLAAGYLFINL